MNTPVTETVCKNLISQQDGKETKINMKSQKIEEKTMCLILTDVQHGYLLGKCKPKAWNTTSHYVGWHTGLLRPPT